MRIALKLAYIGTDYNGMQIQPGVPTIEGELFRALVDLNIISDPRSARYGSSGRTDSGVHALGQVVAFDTENANLAVPRVINSILPPSLWAWSRAEAPENFDPRRHAISREYRYIMCGCSNIPPMRKASKLLQGTHDFSNFATLDEDKSMVRTIERIDVRLDGKFVFLDIKANSFLWHMVRKIVTALQMIGNGMRDMEWLEQMLHPEEFQEGLEIAPAYGLLLKNVEYAVNLQWEDEVYAKKVASERLKERFMWHGVMAEIFNELKENMQPPNAER